MMAIVKGVQLIHKSKILTHPSKLQLKPFSGSCVCLKQDETPGSANEEKLMPIPKIQQCSRVVNYLRAYGFSEENVSDLIGLSPQIETLNPDKLDMTLHAWSNCQFGDKHFVKLLSSHPQLLMANHSRIEDTFLFLSSRFSKNLVLSIFLTSPLVITDNLDRISDKISYLETDMRVSLVEIAHSGSLSYSLDSIKERFQFLIRVGVYKPMKEKERHLGKFKNPRLDVILNSSDHEFATKVAGLSLFEFEVFQEMMKSQDE